MDSLLEFVTMILAISLATERVVEMIKGMLPEVADKYKKVVFPLLGVLVGAAICAVNGVTLPFVEMKTWIEFLIAGLLCSGGSATWHGVLKVLQAIAEKPVETDK